MGQKEEGEMYEETSERGGKMYGYVDDDLVFGWMVFRDERNESRGSGGRVGEKGSG